nr:reverse transcriptase domain-containing protein [Tanacetum cinerariifolium]
MSNWLQSGGNKTDERLPEDTCLTRPTHVRHEEHTRKGARSQDLDSLSSDAALREYCDKNYHQLLAIIAEKVHQEKVEQERLKAVKARLNFEESSQHSESWTPSKRMDLKKRLGPRHARSMSGSPEPRHDHSVSPRKRNPERKTVFKRLEKGVFHRLGDKGKSMFAYSNNSRRQSYHSSRRDTKSCYRSSRSRETEFAFEKRHNKRSSLRRPEAMSESEGSVGGHWKSKPKRQKSSVEDDLSQPWRVAKQKITQTFYLESVISFSSLGGEDGTEGPIIIEAEMGGHFVHRMYVDGDSSLEILYELCSNRLGPKVRSQVIPATTPLVGFNGEIIWPLGQISLLVKIGNEEHSMSAWMNFMIVRSPSPYNRIIGRPGVRRIQAVPSTTHGILKFLVAGETVTLRSSRIIPLECTMVSGPGVPQPVINQVTEEKIQELCGLLRRNLDIFAWKPADMTGVPRHIAVHRLNIHEGCLPVRQKKIGQAPERNKAIYEEVEKLVDVEIMKEVHYHSWLSNPIMVKKYEGSWRMCVYFKELNKAYPKDGYPLPEIVWKVESLCGYPFKCFLDAYKGYYQIKMAKEDEEKIAFITSQGIFYYSKCRLD